MRTSHISQISELKVCCNVLQCVAMCCSVLLRELQVSQVAIPRCCSSAATATDMRTSHISQISELKVCCNVLQCVAVYCCVLHVDMRTSCVAQITDLEVYCDVLQHVAACCSVLQRVAC